MRHLFFLFAALTASAATVEINLRDFAGASLNSQVTITNTSNPVFGGSNVYTLPAQKYQPRNGQVTATLHAGGYKALVGPYSIAFNVPDDTNTYTLSQVATNGSTITAVASVWYPSSNPSNYVTASITNGLGGGGGTTYTNANIRVGLISGSSIGTNTSLLLSTNEFYSASNSMVSAWTAGDAAHAVELVRGTNRTAYSTLLSATNALQPFDTIIIRGTNATLNFEFYPPDNLTIRGQGKQTVLNVYTNAIWAADGLTISDLSIIGDYVASDNITKPFVKFTGGAGTTATNMTFERLFVNNPAGNFRFRGSDATGLLAVKIADSEIYCSVNGVEQFNLDPASTMTIENCRFVSIVKDGQRDEILCSIRATGGTNYLRDLLITTQGAGFENIGVYVRSSTTYFQNVRFVDMKPATNSLLPTLNVIVETSGTVVDLDGCLSSDDITYNLSSESTVKTNLGAPWGKLGTGEIAFTANNGLTVSNGYFQDLTTIGLTWVERSNWWPVIRGYPYLSNSFASLAQGYTNNIQVSNALFNLTFSATNGLLVTNLLGTNWLTTSNLADFILVTNNSATNVGFIAQGIMSFSSAWANAPLSAPQLWYDYLTQPVATNPPYLTNLSRTAVNANYTGMTNSAVWKYSPLGSRRVGLRDIEIAAAKPGRELRFEFGLTNLNASQLTGTVPNAALSGVTITNLTVNRITNGYNTAPGTIELWDDTAAKYHRIQITDSQLTLTDIELAPLRISGIGSGLTELNASQLTTGTVPAGRLTTAGTNLVGAVLTSDGVGNRYWTNAITNFSSVAATNLIAGSSVTAGNSTFSTSLIRSAGSMYVGSGASLIFDWGNQDSSILRHSIGTIRVRTNAVVDGYISSTNGFVDVPRSSAPTFAQIGSRTNTPVMWWSNSAPCVRYVTYYDASSNAVTTNLFSLP